MNENKCRICLCSAKRDFKDLFFDGGVGSTLADNVKFCSGVEIHKDDNLPQRICLDCSVSIKSACDIKVKCIETDRLLRFQFKVEPYEEDFKNLEDAQKLTGLETTSSFNKTSVKIGSDKLKSNTEFTIEPSVLESKFPSSDDKSTKAEAYGCVFCGDKFKTMKQKKEHMQIKHSKEVTCQTCNKSRRSVFAVEKCIKDHQFGFPFLCQICAKGFRGECYLKRHQSQVHFKNWYTERRFSCDNCGFKTKHKQNIKGHMRAVHLTEGRFHCPHDACSALSYSSKNSLNIHLYRFHDVPAPVTCLNCSAGFNTEGELKTHRLRCSGKYTNSISRKPVVRHKKHKEFFNIVGGKFLCKVCPKTYESKPKWYMHYIGYHADNKTCNICSKTFTTAPGCFKHVKVVHLKIKNYHCEQAGCGKSFGSKWILDCHRNTHTGEKPFACSFCDFRSGDLPTVSKHKKKVHSEIQKLSIAGKL